MKILLVVFLPIFFVGCAHRNGPPSTATLLKSEMRREVTQREAFAGDNAAARAMGDYYLAKNDRDNCIWWYQLAASRGDQVAKETLEKLLRAPQ